MSASSGPTIRTSSSRSRCTIVRLGRRTNTSSRNAGRAAGGDGGLLTLAGESDNQKNCKGVGTMSINRRTVVKGALAAGVAAQALKVPAAVAQPGPIKVGFLTIKSGALASGGLQMEQGLVTYFKQHDNKMAGRAVELHTQDTGGNPAQ